MNRWNELGQGAAVNLTGCAYLLMHTSCVATTILPYKPFNALALLGKSKCVAVQNILSYVLEGAAFEEHTFR